MNRLRILTAAVVCLGLGGFLLPVLSPSAGRAQQAKDAPAAGDAKKSKELKDALKLKDELIKALAERDRRLEEEKEKILRILAEHEKEVKILRRELMALKAVVAEDAAASRIGGALQASKDAPTMQEYADMVRVLQEPIETKGLQKKVRFKQALEYLTSPFKGKLIVLVDRNAFLDQRDQEKREPDEAKRLDLYDQEVSLPTEPAKMSLNLALRMILAQVEGGRATFAIRADHLAIVPLSVNVPKEPPPPTPVNPGDEARDIVRLLHMPIETKGLQEPVKLHTALEYFSDKFSGKLPIIVDWDAFPDGFSDASNPYEEDVRLPSGPKTMLMSTALRLILSQVGKGQATYLIRGSHIEITSFKNSTAASFLYRPCITATFEERPLSAALQTLTDQTGLAIQLDPNLGIKARTTITANFRNSSLEDALVTITEMAELKFVALERSIYVTTPEKAKAIQKEESLRSKKREAEQKKWAPKRVEGA